jgi:ADP-ribose pyrophosphatase YjhB (NUDIX family)
MSRRFLLGVWRILPAGFQIILSRVIRPLFQVFSVGVIFNDAQKILLVKSTYQRFHPWGLPGGSLDYGETPEEAVKREILEETGLTVEIERFLFVKTWSPDRVGVYYLCKIIDGEFYPTDEVSEAAYFSPYDLPDVRPVDIDLIRNLYRMVVHELA